MVACLSSETNNAAYCMCHLKPGSATNHTGGRPGATDLTRKTAEIGAAPEERNRKVGMLNLCEELWPNSL